MRLWDLGEGKMMSVVKIERTSDVHRCETCGSSWAEGAKIFVDGKLVKELKPVAHCFGGQSFDDEDVLRATLAHFGHELEYDHEG